MKFITFLNFLILVTISIANSDDQTNNISKYLKLNVNLECYYLNSFNKIDDSLNITEFAGNSKFIDEFRLNVASITFSYNNENVRSRMELQFGDNPHLMSQPSSDYVRFISNSTLGYKIIDGMWLDVGYIADPVGYESSKPINNIISSVTVGGYFQPDNFLGLILTYDYLKNLSFKVYGGNPYTLRFGAKKKINLGFQVSYSPIEELNITYSNFFGDNTEVYSAYKEWRWYGNTIITYNPTKDLEIVLQSDRAQQAGAFGDNNRHEVMYSGFIGLRYQFVKNWKIAGRYEFFDDKSGFMTDYLVESNKWNQQPNKWNGYGMNLEGGAVSLEFRPYGETYIRAEYRYNIAEDSQLVFNRNTDRDRQYLLFTTGIRY